MVHHYSLPLRRGEISTFSGERRSLRQDGGEVWVSISTSLVKDAEGRPDYLIDVNTDITERKNLDKSLQRADTVFRNTQEGIVVTDTSGNILAVNPAFTRITGYEETELVGQNMRILQSGQQDREFYRDMWLHIARDGSWQGEDLKPAQDRRTLSGIPYHLGGERRGRSADKLCRYLC